MKFLFLTVCLGITAPIFAAAAAAAEPPYKQTASDCEFFRGDAPRFLGFCGLEQKHFPIQTVDYASIVFKALYKKLALEFHPDKTRGDEPKEAYFKTLGVINEFMTHVLSDGYTTSYMNEFNRQNGNLRTYEPQPAVMVIVLQTRDHYLVQIQEDAIRQYDTRQREQEGQQDPISRQIVAKTHLYTEHSPLSSALQEDLVKTGRHILSQLSSFNPHQFFEYLNTRHNNQLLNQFSKLIYAPRASQIEPTLLIKSWIGRPSMPEIHYYLTSITAVLWTMMDIAYAQTNHHFSHGSLAFEDRAGTLYEFFRRYVELELLGTTILTKTQLCNVQSPNMGWKTNAGTPEETIEIDARLEGKDGVVSIFPNGFTHVSVSKKEDMTYVRIMEIGGANLATYIRSAQVGASKNIFGDVEPTHRSSEIHPHVLSAYSTIKAYTSLVARAEAAAGADTLTTAQIPPKTIREMYAELSSDHPAFVTTLQRLGLDEPARRLGNEVIITRWTY